MLRFFASFVSTLCGCLGVGLLLLAPISGDLYAVIEDPVGGGAKTCTNKDGIGGGCKNQSLTNCGANKSCDVFCSCQKPPTGLYCQCCDSLGCD